MLFRCAFYAFVLAFIPSQKQNVAITEDGRPVCGAVLLSDTIVLTAAHCVFDRGYEKPYADVRCGSTDQPAEVLKASLDEDLAVLRLILPCTEQEKTYVAAINAPIGSEVHAVGYPAGKPRLSRGIVSAYETSSLGGNVRHPEDYVLHPVLVSDTKIFFGNSGGGLFNRNNELVGIASQLDSAGYGYWIPASSIRRFLAAP